MHRLLPIALLAALGACAARTPPVEVVRFNLGGPIERGSVALQRSEAGTAGPLEERLYEDAVLRQLERVGYVQGASVDTLYLARVDVATGTRAALAQRSPISIGIGGGTGGYGGGVGLGASFGLGGGGSRDVVMTELSVQLRRRSDGSVVWEGRAQGEARAGTEAADPRYSAERLADALFRDFPGNNGEVVSIR